MTGMVALVKRLMASRLSRPVDVVRIYREHLLDATAYAASSRRDLQLSRSDGYASRKAQLDGQIIRAYHQIEKGMALPTPRRSYGIKVKERLVKLLALAAEFPDPPASVSDGRSALEALDNHNSTGAIDSTVAPLPQTAPDGADDAARLMELFERRHSVRDFDASRPVDRNALKKAVELAGTSPSVCNRKPWHVSFFDSTESKKAILRLQRGASGFGDGIPVVAVISVERSLFTGEGERFQEWIEGGIFAMNLVWGLQGQGLDSCLLNWSKRNRETRALRSVTGLSDSHDVIVVVGIGHGRAGHRVTRSPRRTLDELCTFEN